MIDSREAAESTHLKVSGLPDHVRILSDTNEGGAAGSTKRMLRLLHSMNPSLKHWFFGAGISDVSFAHSLDNRKKRPSGERIVKNFSRVMADKMMASRHLKLFQNVVRQDQISVLNIRNIHSCGLDHRSLLIPELREVPLVWTLHDCWAVKEYAFKFQNRNAGETQFAVRSRDAKRAQQIRNDFFSRRPDTVLVSPSRWLAKIAAEATENKVNVEYIPNGVPLDIFYPRHKAQIQKTFGLDSQRIWLGFASTWANSRKGVDLLQQALARMNNLPLGILCWGGEIKTSVFPKNVLVRHCGRIFDPEISASLYSACDLFVCPSRADNLPNTCIESIACGTPVVGSSAGGIPEIVVDKKSGWIFESDDASDLCKKLNIAVQEVRDGVNFRDSCVIHASSQFDVKNTAESYAKLLSKVAAR